MLRPANAIKSCIIQAAARAPRPAHAVAASLPDVFWSRQPFVPDSIFLSVAISMRFRARSPARGNRFRVQNSTAKQLSHHISKSKWTSPMNRIETLLAAMTLEEKIGQLNMAAAGSAVTGPVLASDATPKAFAPGVSAVCSTFGEPRRSDAMHKDRGRGKTSLGIPLLARLRRSAWASNHFPDPARRGGRFDPSLWEAHRPRGGDRSGRRRHRITFAPMLDIARDPRWGRIAEGAGEDPWVATQFAKAKVRGFQGDGLPEGLAVPKPLPPRPSISAPMARPLPDATMPQPMFRNVFCTKSICRPSRRPWPLAAPRSCRPSTISPAFR